MVSKKALLAVSSLAGTLKPLVVLLAVKVIKYCLLPSKTNLPLTFALVGSLAAAVTRLPLLAAALALTTLLLLLLLLALLAAAPAAAAVMPPAAGSRPAMAKYFWAKALLGL
jgi:hypothetical protein